MGRAKKKQIEQNLDSLLDILSNVVGVMILLAVIITLNMQTTTLSLGTPIIGEPPVHAKRLLFECTNNRIAFIDVDGLDSKIKKLQHKYQQETASRPNARQLAVLLKDEPTKVEDRSYRVTIELKGGVNFIYTPQNKLQGESPGDLQKETSGYIEMLQQLNPEEHWLFFAVRPSGYEIFRQARAEAKEYKLAVGWNPLPGDGPVVLRTGGMIGGDTQN